MKLRLLSEKNIAPDFPDSRANGRRQAIVQDDDPKVFIGVRNNLKKDWNASRKLPALAYFR